MSGSLLSLDILVAHRGLQSRYPENTILALKKAIECGAKYIELDIQFSSDCLPVIYHDIEKNNKYINEFSVEELKKLDILSLQEFLNRINIDEIKFFFDIKGSFKIIYPLIDILKREFDYNQLKNVFISGFDRTYIDILTSFKLPINIGFTTSNNFTINEIKILTNSIQFICFEWNVLNTQTIKYLKDNNILVFSFTCENDFIYQHIKKFNIDGIITNYYIV